MRKGKPPLREITHAEVVGPPGSFTETIAAGSAVARDTRPVPFPDPVLAGLAYAFQPPVYHPGQWLSVPEAAAYTGLPQSALRKLMSAGRLRSLDTGPRVGGRWRIKRSDLDAI